MREDWSNILPPLILIVNRMDRRAAHGTPIDMAISIYNRPQDFRNAEHVRVEMK